MAEYESSIVVEAAPDTVFQFVSDVRNLPKYLPTTHHAEPLGEDKVRVQGKAAGHLYDSDGYFRVSPSAHKMEWGSDGKRRYMGCMEITALSRDKSKVTVYLTFGRPQEMKRTPNDTGEDHDAVIQEGMNAALCSIKNFVEGRGGKEEPSAAQ